MKSEAMDKGSLLPLNFIVSRFAAEVKILTGAWVALVVSFGCSLLTMKALKETHGRDLDFLE